MSPRRLHGEAPPLMLRNFGAVLVAEPDSDVRSLCQVGVAVIPHLHVVGEVLIVPGAEPVSSVRTTRRLDDLHRDDVVARHPDPHPLIGLLWGCRHCHSPSLRGGSPRYHSKNRVRSFALRGKDSRATPQVRALRPADLTTAPQRISAFGCLTRSTSATRPSRLPAWKESSSFLIVITQEEERK